MMRDKRPSHTHMWDPTSEEWYSPAEFSKLKQEYYRILEEQSFYDIESGLDSPPLLKPHHSPMNAVAAQNGPFVTKEGAGRGREWEELVSEGDRWVDTHNAGRARYAHVAQLVATQEYTLCRLGTHRAASEKRASWALHAQGISERDIARFLGINRWDVEGHIAHLKEIVLAAIDAEN